MRFVNLSWHALLPQPSLLLVDPVDLPHEVRVHGPGHQRIQRSLMINCTPQQGCAPGYNGDVVLTNLGFDNKGSLQMVRSGTTQPTFRGD